MRTTLASVTLVEDDIRVVSTVYKLTNIIHHGLMQYGLIPSYDNCKSQILAAMRVPATFTAKSDLYDTLGATLTVKEVFRYTSQPTWCRMPNI